MKFAKFSLFTILFATSATFAVSTVSSSDLANDQVSLDKPVAMKAGHNQPRRVFIDESLLDVPLNYSWNFIPTKPVQSLSNWLTYGGTGEETEQFMIGVHFKGQMPFRSQGLRNAVASLKVFKDAKIKPVFVGRSQQVDTKFGMLDTINFGYKKNGLTKVCLGYLSQADSIKLRGFYCAEDPTAKWQYKLPCLVNSLRIHDEAYWVEPEDVKIENNVCSLDKTTESKI
jgi:hypothetical protein